MPPRTFSASPVGPAIVAVALAGLAAVAFLLAVVLDAVVAAGAGAILVAVAVPIAASAWRPLRITVDAEGLVVERSRSWRPRRIAWGDLAAVDSAQPRFRGIALTFAAPTEAQERARLATGSHEVLFGPGLDVEGLLVAISDRGPRSAPPGPPRGDPEPPAAA